MTAMLMTAVAVFAPVACGDGNTVAATTISLKAAVPSASHNRFDTDTATARRHFQDFWRPGRRKDIATLAC
ncbi:hypothetical protein D2E80_23815 [Mycobacteroides abscessus]|nr:hypothetical protein D2E80_23815 [Mycobacteroides abscessus]